MTPSVRVLLFDFGNVIAFFDHWLGAARTAQCLGPSVDAGEVYRFYYGTPLEDQHERGRISSDEVLRRLKDRFNPQTTCKDADLARAFGDIFRPNPTVIELIRDLPSEVRLILASNTNELHYRFFRPMFADVLDCFAELVVSFRVGCRKPEPEFYRACVTACQSSPQEILFVDDRDENIRGAEAVGLRAIRYEPTLDLRAILSQELRGLWDGNKTA